MLRDGGPVVAAAEQRLEVIDVGGRVLRLRWHELADCPVDLSGLDSVVRGLIAGPEQRDGYVLCVLDADERPLGASAVDLTSPPGAPVAVAVARAWRHRGLGGLLAVRIVGVARVGGAQFLTCRCPVGVDDADRVARLFG